MRRAHPVPAAALALTGLAVFAGNGSSDSRLFWIGSAVLLAVGAAGVALFAGRFPAPALSPAAVAFLALRAALAGWQAVSMEWSILPSRSWDYANRGFVYFAFACL